jgi:DNA-binding LacI/PurR family transcriptional regulator
LASGFRLVPQVTQLDVARRAGVSRALVSIVMRGVNGASAEATARVLAAAEELGYRPDARARSLAGRRSRVIGVMFGVSVGTFHFDLLDGLYAAAEELGQSLIVAPLTKLRDELKAADTLQDFRFDGLIMLSPPTSRPLLAGKVPIVVVGWRVDDPSVDVVRASDEQGIGLAVDHLVGLGHRRIAHVDGGDTAIAEARRAAYVASMTRHGLAGYVRTFRGGQSQLEGLQAAREVLNSGDLPTALVAYNDDVAVAAIGLLRQQGVAVPGRVSVTGFDNGDAVAMSPVPLTTVAQRPDQLGRLAVERIIERVGHRRVVEREVVLPVELIVRSSTAAPFDRAD